MRRDQVDLHYIRPEHAAVHLRLVNWGHWSNPRSMGNQQQPMFRGYEPYAFPRDASGASTVDQLDAQAVQKIMHKMPQKHARALGFAYVHPYVHVNKVCRILAVNVRDLAELGHEARTMAKNLLR